MAKSQHEITVEIAGKIASSFGSAMGSVNKQMATLGKFAGGAAKLTMAGMAAAGTAIAGVAAASVNVGKAFESQMSTVGAIAGSVANEDLPAVVNAANEMGLAFKEGANATETTMNILEAKAKQMGATTQFSATEAGQAMEYMAMAGWKGADMVQGIDGIMNLAAASGEDLASTSDIVTDALTAFGMTASESGKFADVLAAASSSANTNVSMLGESFKYVAPLAGTLGYTAEDTSIALGLMANAGIKGSQAGTSLKTALARMSAPTAKQAAAMNKLGISLTDGEGNMKSLRDIMGDLRTSFAGMSESEQAAAASTIFGKEAMSGMLAIINAGESDFDKLTAAIDESAGSAERMAAVRLDNLEGDITLLKSAAEGLGIEIYQGMNAPMREAAQAASGYLAQMNAAFQEDGFSGLAEAIGDVGVDALTRIVDHAPEFIDMAATLIDSFIDGIDRNSGKIGASMGRLIVVLASAIVRLAPRLMTAGANLLLQIGRGIIQNLPELEPAAREAVSYLMNAAKDALGEYVDFLGDDSIAPFEKFIALIPAVAAGFAAFGVISNISKKISGFIGSIKKAGKAAPGFTQASSEMSAAAKNIAAIGAGLALAAAGIWLLADAAIRISSAGPAAQTGLIAMAAGVGALILIASKLGPELSSAKKGLIAFGAAVLMISAAMSLMAYAATQLAAAGPMALVGLAVMEGGMIAMMVIADKFGKKLTNAAPGLLAFGAAVLLASAGMSLMAAAAAQLGSAGAGAVVTLGLMVAGLAGFMAIAAAMGPQLTAASAGLIAFGAGITLAAAGLYIMTQAAIQLGAAGTPAQIALAALAVGILAFGAAAGALAPLLLAGAAALAAFGAALAVVSAAALLGSAALLVISTALPALSEYGASGALAIMELGAAMTVFAAGAALAGAGAGVAALGFGALALAAAAADLAFAPLAVEMVAVAGAVAVIAAGAGAGADGINSLRESSSGMITSMGKLALAFAPVAAAIVPFTATVTAGAAVSAALAAALAATGAALFLVGTGAVAAGTGLQLITFTLVAFRTAAATMGTSASMASAAMTKFATSFSVVSAPMAAFRTNARTTFTGVQMVVITSTMATTMQFISLWRTAQSTITATWASYRGSFASAWSGVHSYAVNAAVNTAQQIKAAFEHMTITIPRPRIPKISVSTSSVSYGEGGNVSVPNFSVSYYAKGGIMNDPTLFGMVGGEAGPEGIIPLDPFWNHLDSAVSAAVQQHSTDGSAQLNNAMQDASGLERIHQSAVSGVDSRAKEVYSDITNNNTVNRSNDNSSAENSQKIIFSPQITIQGNANKEDVQRALQMSQADFTRMMEEYNWQNGRTAMA